MKSLLLKILLVLFIISYSSSIAQAQSLKDLVDSTDYYYKKQDFESALKWAKLSLPQAEKEFGIESNYINVLGAINVMFYYTGQLDSAIHYGELQLVHSRKLFNIDSTILAESISKLAFLYDQKGYYEKSEQLNNESLDIFRRIYKTDNADLAKSISQLASSYISRGNYNKAEQLFLEAYEMRKRLFHSDHPDLASSLNDLGNLYYRMGDYKKTESYIAECLEMMRHIYNIDDYKFALTINNAATMYYSIGKSKNAEPLFIESVEMMRRIFKTGHPLLATCINQFARFYNDLGNYLKAKTLYFEALEMRRQIYQTDHPDIAQSLNNLANYYYYVNDYEKAEKFYIDALDMYRRIYKKDNPEIATVLNNNAVFYKQIGNYAKAEPLFNEALEMRKRIFKTDHPDIALSLNNSAVFYRTIGMYQKAERFYNESLNISRKIFKTDHPILASNLNSIAGFYLITKDYIKAERFYLETVNMLKRIYNTDHPSLAEDMNNLACLYACTGDFNKAKKINIEALDMMRRIFKGDDPRLASGINNLANIYKTIGDYNKAESLYFEALDMTRRIFKNAHPDLAQSIFSLASCYYFTGKYPEAEALFLEGLDVQYKIFTNFSYSLSQNEQEQFWNTMKQNFDQFNSFAVLRSSANKNILCRMFDNQLITKGILLNSYIKTINGIRNSGNVDLQKKFEDWKFQKNIIIKLQSQSPLELAWKGINLDSLINDANDKEKELSQRSEDFKKGYEKKITNWKDVQKSLREDDAAIEFVRMNNFVKSRTDTIYYAALIVKDTSSVPELVLLKNGNDLEVKYIEEYRNQAGQFKKRVYDPDKVNDKLKELYSQFWAPIQEKLKGIKTVYLSPDGVYNLLNLNTLINPETGKYLLEEIDLRLVTSTRDLVNRSLPLNPPQEGDTKSPPFSKGGREVSIAELFGDPQFDLDSTKYELLASNIRSSTTREYYSLSNTLDSATRGAISSLPGTRKEIENIANSFQKQGWGINKHLGPEALEEALKAVDNPRVLHIATHGKFLKDVERRDDERMMGFETQRFVENPLLRSMLLFSGAENTLLNQGQHSATQREDGLLTAYEAQNLNLDNTELVVLSACETGLGEIKNGEGVYGLQRAFQVAGAKSLIMSLWSVSDEATQELMTSFYSKWLGGKSKREAFREAQMELKKKYPGFYYWGAFVMVGE